MKGAIIGFGNIAEHAHLPAFEKLGIEIAACVDVRKERREKAEKLGMKSFSTLSELKAEIRDIEFVDITTPPSFRYEPIKFALENHVDVLCEKPLILPDKIEELKSLLNSSNSFVFPIHNWKKAPQYKKAGAVARENGVDEIKIEVLRTSPAKGCSAWNPDWRKKVEFSGGGIIMDHGYHNIYLVSFLLGAKFEEFKDAELIKIAYFQDEKRAEKKALFKLFFGKEKKAEIYLDWCADKREVSCAGYRNGEAVFKLKEDRLLAGGKEYFFDKISDNSLHSNWTLESIKEFKRERAKKSKKYLFEGVKVIEIIKLLYDKASLLR